MRVQIVLHDANKGGIIGKIAKRLAEIVPEFGIDCRISNEPSNDVDLNHFMMYYASQPVASTRNTMFITHVDDASKYSITKELLKKVDMGICMSRMTIKRLVDHCVSEERLCFVTPAHDGLISPRRIRVGLTTNLYEDGRKREDLLVRLGREIGFQGIEFEIFGEGWKKTAEDLRAFGAEVNLHESSGDYLKDYETMVKAIPGFDYYLYLGLDEGSMGTLDALAAGVPLIVTMEGFHMDLGVPIEHPFIHYSELKSIFQKLLTDRKKKSALASSLTWREYGRKHAMIWRELVSGTGSSHVKSLLHQTNVSLENIDGYSKPSVLGKLNLLFVLFNPNRREMAKNHYISKYYTRIIWPLKGWVLKFVRILIEEGILKSFQYAIYGIIKKTNSAHKL
jgi:hypothetical protein